MAERTERRLTAILAADVVGYSRMMGVDEEGTLAQLKLHRSELIDPRITEYRGRIVKTTGDGVLVEFVSVVDAVLCAVDIRRGMVARNAEVPRDRRIQLRISINVGDIVVDGGDIYGDGVNVAARLEGLVEPGRHLRLQPGAGGRVREIRNRLRGCRRAAAQEHRAAGAGVSAAPGGQRSKTSAGAEASRQTLDCGASVPEHERRSGAGLFCQRDRRGPHHRIVPHALVVRDRP